MIVKKAAAVKILVKKAAAVNPVSLTLLYGKLYS